MPYFITQVDKEKAMREDIKDIPQFFERKGEQLFGEGVGDLKTFKERYPDSEVRETESGIEIVQKTGGN